MYKNQKIYFSKPNIPDEVLKKSLIKVNKPKKQIKKKPEKIKPKSGKQVETEKLLKYYGRNNNMIALLIYLLKRKDETKRRYKTKSTYRMGYKKSNTYQTRTQIDKGRKSEQRKAEGKLTFQNISKLLNQAQIEAGLGNSRKEQELLKKALKISENYLTNQDYETYGKFLTEEERKNPELIARMKKAAEEAIIKAEQRRKEDLKQKQNLGREQKRLSKEKEMQDYIDGLIFTQKLPSSELNKIFDDFKNSPLKEPITGYAKSTFNKLLKQKYDQDILKLTSLSKKEAKKEIEKQQLEKDFQDYFKDKIFDAKPNKSTLRAMKQEIKDNFGKDLTLEEILSSVVVNPPKEPSNPPPKRKTILNEFLESETFYNDLDGIDKQIELLRGAISSADKAKFTRLKKKTTRTEEEEKQLEETEEQFKEVEDFKELLKQRRSILLDYIQQGIVSKDVKESLLPEVSNPAMTNDDYELQLIQLQIDEGDEPSSTDDSGEE